MSGRVTALKVQKRNPQRVNVFLDGEYAFGLSRITAAWLQVGQELSDEKVAQLQAEDARESAYQRATRLLDYRPRSAAEVQRRLREKDIPDEVISDVSERLQRSGLVNDERFAQTWVENRSAFRPRGRRLLAAELRQRGVESEAIEQALDGLDEEELAYQAGLKQSRRLAGLERVDFQRRLAGFLLRRGFGYAVIKPVIERIWNEMDREVRA